MSLHSPRSIERDGALAGLSSERAVFNLVLLLLIASVVLYGAYVLGARMERLAGTGRRVVGTVVRLEPSHETGGQTLAAVVRFKDAAGTSVEFTDSFSSRPPIYEVGEAVVVLYLDEDPKSTAIIDLGWENWFWHGGIFLVAGLALLIWWSKLVREWQDGDTPPVRSRMVGASQDQ